MTKTLRVRPVGSALVTNFEKLEEGVRAYIGRELRPVPESPSGVGFVPTGLVVEVPLKPEYVRALRDGDLEPADAETAAVGAALPVPADVSSDASEPASGPPASVA